MSGISDAGWDNVWSHTVIDDSVLICLWDSEPAAFPHTRSLSTTPFVWGSHYLRGFIASRHKLQKHHHVWFYREIQRLITLISLSFSGVLRLRFINMKRFNSVLIFTGRIHTKAHRNHLSRLHWPCHFTLLDCERMRSIRYYRVLLVNLYTFQKHFLKLYWLHTLQPWHPAEIN